MFGLKTHANQWTMALLTLNRTHIANKHEATTQMAITATINCTAATTANQKEKQTQHNTNKKIH